MTISTLFLNPEDSRLRAGWRIALFLAAFVALNALIFGVFVRLFSTSGIVHSKLLTSLIFCLILFVVTWGMLAWIDRRPLRSVGLGLHERTLAELLQGLGVGAGMMTVIFIATELTGMSEFHLKPLTFAQIVTMTTFSVAEFAIGAWSEELLFRGYLFQTLAEGTSKLIAVSAFAVFFGLMHLGNPNITAFSVVNIALAGVWLSAAYFKTRGLWLPIGLHFSWNFFQNHIFSFPVSGLQMSDTQLGVLRDNGPAWLTGGTFGPEGGAIATVVIIAGTLLIWYGPAFRASTRAWIKGQPEIDAVTAANEIL